MVEILKEDTTKPVVLTPDTQYLRDMERWSVKGKLKSVMDIILDKIKVVLPTYLKKDKKEQN